MAFRFAYRLSGLAPTILPIIAADATLNIGDLVNLESGKADLSVTADTALIGVVTGCADTDKVSGTTISGLNTTTDTVEVCVDADAVYSVTDANARVFGATLDISGATGAQTVAASSNADLVVVADSSATEETKVMIVNSQHAIAGK